MNEVKNVLDTFKLDGFKACVTGAGRGLGRELALGLAEAGANVAVFDKVIKNAESVADEIKELGKDSIALEGDVSKEEDVERVVKSVVGTFGGIDILVCNAGVTGWTRAEDISLEEWKLLMDVNLNGVFLCCKWAGKEMIKQKGGTIINISSMSANVVNIPQQQSHYNTSKAGVSHLTRSLAVEWAEHNIRVNAICPGYIMTPLLKEADKELIDKWISMSPQKRIPDPSEIKGLCVFLASEASGYLTGSCIIADGGYSLW